MKIIDCYYFMKKVLLLLLCVLALSLNAQELSIIPQPANVEVKGGNFLFENKTLLYFPKTVSSDVVSVAERFAATLDVATGLELEISSYKSFEKANKRKKAKIILVVDNSLADEEYKLNVTDKTILVTAAEPAGFFYAFQTLKQLMPASNESLISQSLLPTPAYTILL